MKKFLALSVLATAVLSSTSSFAATQSRYDELIESCLNYAPMPISTEDEVACKNTAARIVLADQKAFEKYLVCVDYEHLPVTEAEKEACLRSL